MALGSALPLREMSTRNISWSICTRETPLVGYTEEGAGYAEEVIWNLWQRKNVPCRESIQIIQLCNFITMVNGQSS
jgi:hypothetical protein